MCDRQPRNFPDLLAYNAEKAFMWPELRMLGAFMTRYNTETDVCSISKAYKRTSRKICGFLPAHVCYKRALLPDIHSEWKYLFLPRIKWNYARVCYLKRELMIRIHNYSRNSADKLLFNILFQIFTGALEVEKFNQNTLTGHSDFYESLYLFSFSGNNIIT